MDSLVSHQLRLLYGGAADGEGGGYLLNTTLAYNEARKDYFIFLKKKKQEKTRKKNYRLFCVGGGREHCNKQEKIGSDSKTESH